MLLKQRNCPPLCAGVLITVISAFGQTTGTLSDGTVWLQLQPVGLAVSETAQVNVVNTGVTAGVGPYCVGSIVFYDIGGSVLGTPSIPGGPTTVTPGAFSLGGGQTFSAALPFSSANASGPRAVIRAIIYIGAFKVATAAGPMVAPCWISSSLETYDSATGVTHAIVTGSTALNPSAPEARNTKASRAYEDSQLLCVVRIASRRSPHRHASAHGAPRKRPVADLQNIVRAYSMTAAC